MSADTAQPAPSEQPEFSPAYRNGVLWLLVVAYTFNFIDRTIISTIATAIKEDLQLTDLQIGWLTGLSFALLYTTLGIPIARLAERSNRVNIIAIAIVVWSAFTALCGTATSYLQLLLYRIGVGVGEAGLNPPAHSLISDYFEPKKRATALSVYAFGIPLGTMFGAMAGGWIAENLSWQAAFMAVGLPGILVAVVIKIFIKEPPRGWADEQVAIAAGNPTAPPAPGAVAEPMPSIRSVAGRLFGSWGMFHMVAGTTVASFAGYGTGAYAPAYFIREFGLGLATVGLLIGLIGGISNGSGTILGGVLADFASKRSARWYALIPAIGLLVATPIYIYAYTRESWQFAVWLLLIPGVFHYAYLGPTFAVVQNVMNVRMRATATAILLFVVNIIALGFGPPFCGWCIDQFARMAFAARGMAGDFLEVCRGGMAPAGASPELAAACPAAMAEGTRWGIVSNLLIYGWAGVHYLLAAITLPKDMAKATGQA
jgi:MFS family permease